MNALAKILVILMVGAVANANGPAIGSQNGAASQGKVITTEKIPTLVEQMVSEGATNALKGLSPTASVSKVVSEVQGVLGSKISVDSKKYVDAINAVFDQGTGNKIKDLSIAQKADFQLLLVPYLANLVLDAGPKDITDHLAFLIVQVTDNSTVNLKRKNGTVEKIRNPLAIARMLYTGLATVKQMPGESAHDAFEAGVKAWMQTALGDSRDEADARYQKLVDCLLNAKSALAKAA